MELSPVLSPGGVPMFSAGGAHAWKTFEHRGFVVSLEWVGRNRRNPQQCIVIWPASNVMVRGETHGMWTISRRALVEFVQFNSRDKVTGNPSEHCMREARQALPILGKDANDRHALHALCDVVVKAAEEIVRMPVAPRRVKQELSGAAMWDVVATNRNNGKTISEASV